jgi:hypothetical protein
VARRPHVAGALIRRAARRVAAVLTAVLAVAPHAHAAAPPSRAEEAAREAARETEILDALLGQLLGLEEVTALELQKLVAEAGGVAFTKDVLVEFLTADELKRYLREAVDSEYPPARATADARLLAALDLVDVGIDLQQERLKLLEQNIAGFYDERPDRRRLYVVSANHTLTPLNQIILAHEMRHALQDQHADVHAVLPESIGDFDDRRLAYLCLLEGDATLIMERFLKRRLGHEDSESASDFALPMNPMPGTPPILRDQMVLPYVIGTPFARELWRKGGWTLVEKAWREPPLSTEQVLHPEKYWAGERPLPAENGYLPRGGTLVYEGVLGEAFLRTLLGEDPSTDAAAEGWGGDRLRLFDVSGKTFVAWRDDSDSEADARELETALRARYRRTHTEAAPHGKLTVFGKAGFCLSTFRHGATVWLISSDSRPLLDDALTELTARKGD